MVMASPRKADPAFSDPKLYVILLLWNYGNISGWKTLLVEFLWQDSFQIHTKPLPKSKRMGKYLWKMMKMIIHNCEGFHFPNSRHPACFHIMSGPQLIEAARSPFSKSEGCFVLHRAGLGFLTAVHWGRRILLLKKCNMTSDEAYCNWISGE